MGKKYKTYVCLPLYSILNIAISFLMLTNMYHSIYEQRYGSNLRGWFNLRELLEIACVVCIVFVFFYAIKFFFQTEITGKFEVIEKVAIFQSVACILFAIFGWYFCLWGKCGHVNCMEVPHIPIICGFISTVIIILEKKRFMRLETDEKK